MKTETPSKTVAVQFARAKVSSLYASGCEYRFTWWDSTVNAYRESQPAPYHVARHRRTVRIACFAAEMLDLDAESKEHRWQDDNRFPDLKSMLADIRPAPVSR